LLEDVTLSGGDEVRGIVQTCAYGQSPQVAGSTPPISLTNCIDEHLVDGTGLAIAIPPTI
jgi:hypothetical protein